jgi:ABC-type sugar transport system permease subunit/ABC-type glycerol-3-phosphate transport system substrate-binding protein
MDYFRILPRRFASSCWSFWPHRDGRCRWRRDQLSRRIGFVQSTVAVLLLMLFTESLAIAKPDEETVRIRVQGLPAANATGVVADVRRAVLQEFLQQNPDIEIEPFVMPAIEGMGMDSTVLMSIAAGVAPNAIYVNFRQSSTYIEQGFLLPVEILLARLLSENDRVRQWDPAGEWLEDPSEEEVAVALEKIRERVPAPAWPVVYRPNPQSSDDASHAWALPFSSTVGVLLYRRDLFFEAGLDPDLPPRNWDELMEYARVLTVPERRQYGLSLTIGPNTSWSVYSFLVSMGARAMEENEDGTWRAAYGSREAATAIRFVWDLTRGSFDRDGSSIPSATYTGGDHARMWTRGQIGMQFSSLQEEVLSTVNPQLVGIAPVPASPEGVRAAEVNAAMLGIFAESSPARQLAVMRYIWFLTSPEARRIRTETMVEGGMGMFVNPDLLAEFGYERIMRLVPDEYRTLFQEAMEEGVPEPYGSNTQNIYRHMSVPINAALELPLEGMDREASIDLIEQMLTSSENLVNVRVMGNLSAEDMLFRRIVGGAMLLVVVVAFVWCLAHVWRHFSSVAVHSRMPGRGRLMTLGFLLVTPAIGLTVLWDYIPLIGGLLISLMDFNIVKESTLVYVDNFANVMFDEAFWMGIIRTVYFVVLTLGLGFWPPILLAILLSEVPTDTAKYIYRTIYYLPAVISGVVVMFLWRQLYDPSQFGILNQILMSLNHLGPVSATIIKWTLLASWLSLVALLFYIPWKLEEMSKGVKAAFVSFGILLVCATVYPLVSVFLGTQSTAMNALALQNDNTGGIPAVFDFLSSLIGRFEIEPLRWISSPELAMLCIVIPSVWASSGPGCLLYLAALKTVPEELYEAAEIDGASNLHKIFYIIFPRLKFLIVLQFIAAVVASFKGGTESIMIMTGGGPNGATTIVALEIFFRAFIELDFGMAASMAWIVGAVLMVFTAIQLKMLARAEFKAAG